MLIDLDSLAEGGGCVQINTPGIFRLIAVRFDVLQHPEGKINLSPLAIPFSLPASYLIHNSPKCIYSFLSNHVATLFQSLFRSHLMLPDIDLRPSRPALYTSNKTYFLNLTLLPWFNLIAPNLVVPVAYSTLLYQSNVLSHLHVSELFYLGSPN